MVAAFAFFNFNTLPEAPEQTSAWVYAFGHTLTNAESGKCASRAAALRRTSLPCHPAAQEMVRRQRRPMSNTEERRAVFRCFLFPRLAEKLTGARRFVRRSRCRKVSARGVRRVEIFISVAAP
jgi:hypothetical protein